MVPTVIRSRIVLVLWNDNRMLSYNSRELEISVSFKLIKKIKVSSTKFRFVWNLDNNVFNKGKNVVLLFGRILQDLFM